VSVGQRHRSVTGRHQTAFRGHAPCSPTGQDTVTPLARDAPDTSPFPRSGHAKLRTRSPKGHVAQEESAGESRPLSARCPLRYASVPLGSDSVVGPLRLARQDVESGDPATGTSSGHRRGGQSKRMGSGIGRNAFPGVQAPHVDASYAVATSSQFGSQLPAPGRMVHRVPGIGPLLMGDIGSIVLR
jgi:hypothetical protein